MLNLYARKTWLFVDAHEVAELFADHASLVLGFARTSRQLHAAVESRAMISKALGIMMERYTSTRSGRSNSSSGSRRTAT